jgi:hypothetical protein
MPPRSIWILLAFPLFGCVHQRDDTAALAAKQALVVERGRAVMPFDIDRTMHHFKKMPTGGVQQVLSIDDDPRQVALIREHLKSEAARFQNGDYADPASIHGSNMPGLQTLAARSHEITIRYSDVPGGGQITYTSADPTLTVAIHKWFDAQVREHGRHAMSS